MRVMYRENMSEFTEPINLDQEIDKIKTYGPINDIDESEETNTGPSPGQIAKEKKLALLQSKLQPADNAVQYIATNDAQPMIFSNDSIADREKLVIRIMGDLYKFSAEHAHVVASFIFAVGLYRVGTDTTLVIGKFVSFLNTIKPTGTQIVSATKFAFYATTAFSSVLFWMGYNPNSIQTELLDKVNSKYNFKNVGIDNVIINHTIIGNIPKNITLATVMNDLYTGLACLSKVCTNTIPTIVRNAKNRVYSIASQTFTNIIDMQEAISTIFDNYLEINEYSEDDISTVSGILSQKSTQSILSSKTLATIIETTNVASGDVPSQVIDQIIEENDKIVEANVKTVATQDFTDTEVILNNNYEPLSQLSDGSDGFNEDKYKSDSDDEYIQDNKKQKTNTETNTDENVGGKSRRKHNKNTHKKRNKKTHKKHNKKTNKKTNKKSRKQRRSRKH